MQHSIFSISKIVVDVESALQTNFNEQRVEALTKIFNDFGTIAAVSENVREQISSGRGIQGLAVDKMTSLFKNPWDFAFELIPWAQSKGVMLKQADVGAILNAQFSPENVSPEEWLDMVADPRMALCDPRIVSRLITAQNMTNDGVQVR